MTDAASRKDSYTSPVALTTANASSKEGTSAARSVLLPLLNGWRALLIAGFLGGAITATAVLLMPRRYAAIASLTPVNSRSMLTGNAGLAASLLGGQGNGGIQATPAFVTQLARMNGVLTPVALSPVRSGSPERVVDRIAGKPPGGVALERVNETIRHAVSATYDMQTGIITLRVEHRDSALARLVVNRVIDQLSVTFVRASRAQASEVRRAQDARVDSAAKQLRRAEDELLRFLSANRGAIMPYSAASVENARLQRVLSMAQEVYTQAVSDRESAIAKELEETPAVVVLDSVPSRIAPESRGVVLKAILAAFAAMSVVALIIVVRAQLRQAAVAGDPHARDLADAIGEVPLLRHLLPK